VIIFFSENSFNYTFKNYLGDLTSQTAIWETGPLTVLAFNGGLSNITRRYLMESKKYHDFWQLIKMLYTFKNISTTTNNVDIPFALPPRTLPNVGEFCECDPGQSFFSSD